MFSVADRGPGIAEADRPHVADRFVRRPAFKRGDSGLGLTIVSAAMKAAQGTEITKTPRTEGCAALAVRGADRGQAARSGISSPSHSV